MNEDRITVYAAQASFFVVISSIPFIMLLFSLSRYLVPASIYDVVISFGDRLPETTGNLFKTLVDEVYAKPAMKLISVTAVLTFWSTSRSIASIRGGVSTVYKSNSKESFLSGLLSSFVYTAIFIILMLVSLVILLFGDMLMQKLTGRFEFIAEYQYLFKYKTLVIFGLLTLFFHVLFYSAGRNSEITGRSYGSHFPGAILAAAGWVLFSYLFSLYTIYFPASYIYGSLTAIILIMLWLYSCMIILMLGAEFNKVCALTRKKRREKKAEKKRLKKEAKEAAAEIKTEE